MSGALFAVFFFLDPETGLQALPTLFFLLLLLFLFLLLSDFPFPKVLIN